MQIRPLSANGVDTDRVKSGGQESRQKCGFFFRFWCRRARPVWKQGQCYQAMVEDFAVGGEMKGYVGVFKSRRVSLRDHLLFISSCCLQSLGQEDSRV